MAATLVKKQLGLLNNELYLVSPEGHQGPPNFASLDEQIKRIQTSNFQSRIEGLTELTLILVTNVLIVANAFRELFSK